MARKKRKTKFSVTQHNLIPKHTKLNDKQKQTLLKKYNLTIKELPRITSSDPAIQNLKAKTGDIIRINRESKTAGQTEFYRVVVQE